ncbi:hypothetical protein J437_LFUL002287, partial [Ladona fulva]
MINISETSLMNGICLGECEGRCSGEPTTPVTFSTPGPGYETTAICGPNSLDPRCKPTRTTPKEICYPG